jgi:hypothetical protein
LFWLATEPLATERDLADFALPATPEKYPRNYVLDGQQRLATIFAVLRWQGKPEDESIFNVSFDLQTETFVRTPAPSPQTYLPVTSCSTHGGSASFQTPCCLVQTARSYSTRVTLYWRLLGNMPYQS